jgi:hypothetical protein
MDPKDLEPDTLLLRLRILDDGEVEVFSGHNITDDVSEEQAHFYIDMLNGLQTMMESATEHVVMIGTFLRTINNLQQSTEIEFEPDEELLEALKDKKVIPFSKNKLN